MMLKTKPFLLWISFALVKWYCIKKTDKTYIFIIVRRRLILHQLSNGKNNEQVYSLSSIWFIKIFSVPFWSVVWGLLTKDHELSVNYLVIMHNWTGAKKPTKLAFITRAECITIILTMKNLICKYNYIIRNQ